MSTARASCHDIRHVLFLLPAYHGVPQFMIVLMRGCILVSCFLIGITWDSDELHIMANIHRLEWIKTKHSPSLHPTWRPSIPML
jgi:hypothetical protein